MTLEEAKEVLNEIAYDCKLKSADACVEYADYISTEFYDKMFDAILVVLENLNEHENRLNLEYAKNNYIPKKKLKDRLEIIKNHGMTTYDEARYNLLYELLEERK